MQIFVPGIIFNKLKMWGIKWTMATESLASGHIVNCQRYENIVAGHANAVNTTRVEWQCLTVLVFTYSFALWLTSPCDRFPCRASALQEKAEIRTMSASAFSRVMRSSIMHWPSQEPCAHGPRSCPAFTVGLAGLS